MVFKVESVIKFAFIILWPRKKRDSMQNHEGIFYGKRRHAKHEKWCVLPRPPLCKKCDVTLSLTLDPNTGFLPPSLSLLLVVYFLCH